jgi:hypothetical protein
MKLRRSIELLTYGVVIILSLVAAGLAIASPAGFTNLNLVYGAF